jgi:hypothetical protein
LVIPGSEAASTQPGGNGYGAVVVNESGILSFSGTLGDGTPVTATSVVSSEGQWPFYAAAYGGKGSILGWLTFTNDGTISGQTGWFKQPVAAARLYPRGFTNIAEVIGSEYHYTNYVPLLGLNGGLLAMTNGNLPQCITNQIELGQFNLATNACGDILRFNTISGFFNGSVRNPETGNPIFVNGIVLQKQNLGAGYFQGTNETGSVVLLPPQQGVAASQ